EGFDYRSSILTVIRSVVLCRCGCSCAADARLACDEPERFDFLKLSSQNSRMRLFSRRPERTERLAEAPLADPDSGRPEKKQAGGSSKTAIFVEMDHRVCQQCWSGTLESKGKLKMNGEVVPN